jgi:serine/threonine-protein kinase
VVKVLRLVVDPSVELKCLGKEVRGPYMIMEYVRGRTVLDMLNRRGALKAEPAWYILDKVIDACIYLYTKTDTKVAIAHLDLKPENIMIAKRYILSDLKQAVKLLDLGHGE